MAGLRYLGVDLGELGALAVIDRNGLLALEDMPIARWTKGKAKRWEYELAPLRRFVERHRPLRLAGYELVHAVPPAMGGAKRSYKLGRAAGIFDALFFMLEVPVTVIPPQTWKKAHGLIGAGKGGSRAVAQRLYPAAELGTRGDEGRSDALLIARYLQDVHRSTRVR